METRASYILVGSFVLGLIAAAFAFVVWLASVQFEEVPMRYVIYFEGGVSGLSVASPVRYRGVPVGSVSDIRIDPENIERIRVMVEISAETPIKADTEATLKLQGITGVSFVFLSGGTHGAAMLEPEKGNALAVIPSRRSGLDQVFESAPELFEKGVILIERLSRLVDDRNLGSIAKTLENIEKLTSTLVSRTSQFEQLIDDAAETVVALKRASDSLEALASDMKTKSGPLANQASGALTDATTTMTDIRTAARTLVGIADLLEEVVHENREPVRDFTTAGLYEITQFVSEARTLVNGLTRLSAQIERSPARFFFGDTQKGLRPN
jgi:phospholipid/cholesterol/gamma-HCH transport system substrate-binding protein